MTVPAISAVVFDLDGVVWLGNHPIDGVAAAIDALRAHGLHIRFFTNNASMHRSAYVEKLASMGIPAELNEIVSSGYAATQYVTKRFGPTTIHVMGSEGLTRELVEAGHTIVDRQATAVVVGYDRTFNWEKLDIAFQNIYADKAVFVACNMDKRYVEKTTMRPGTGATVAALSYSLEQDPEVVAGKPHQPMIDALFDGLAVAPSECLLVGDKLYTDIACGKRAGMQTALVRTGQGSEEEGKIVADSKPDYILDSAAELPQLLQLPRGEQESSSAR